MNFIGKISDEDIGEQIIDCDYSKTRTAVRTILINDDNKIAILHKKNKNEYKLVGGGVDQGESYEEALKRESLEESGCIIKILDELGYVEEYRSKLNFKQISYVYIAKVIENTHKLHLTPKEIEEGSEICWFTVKEALDKMKQCYESLKPSKFDDLYSTRIIMKRDRFILENYINSKAN